MDDEAPKYCIRSGYDYEEYYKVYDQHRTDDLVFSLNVGIMADSNGHIILTSTINPNKDDDVYEISSYTEYHLSSVLGAGDNSYSEVRKRCLESPLLTVDTPDILEPGKYVVFFIRAHEDGLLEIGKVSDGLVLLSYQDPEPVAINYFSFCTWADTVGKFIYYCPGPSNNLDQR